MLIISNQADISPLADIQPSVKGTKITIGAGVIIDSFVKIKPAGGMGDVTIGENTRIMSGVVIYSGNGVQIGKYVGIAANSTLAPVNHEYRSKDKPFFEQGYPPGRGGIIIEDDVWVGANTVILDGAVIRKGCVIGAGSLVKGVLEEYGVYAGNPLVKIGERS
jgi:virginiamycin A acetyltransferase